MEKIIGREEEFEKLSKYMKSEKGEFVAVYGRRRVGKMHNTVDLHPGVSVIFTHP